MEDDEYLESDDGGLFNISECKRDASNASLEEAAKACDASVDELIAKAERTLKTP